MTDLQILTIAVSIVIPVSILIFSNSRITDTRDSVNKRIDNVEKRLELMEKNLREHIDTAFQHMELLLKLHEAEHHSHREGK